MSDLESMVFSLIERYLGGGTGHIGTTRYHERHAVVTSYDPDKYLAKVVYMPEGQESGWLPVETGHIGDSYGIAIGLQPGDGKKSGDQVIVRFQEGDLESGKIVQRVHSDDEKPPRVESGELVIWAKFKNSTGNSGLGDDGTESGGDTDEVAAGGQGGSGQQFYLKKDGSLTLTDGNGATITEDGAGNIKIVGKLIQIDAQTFTVVASGNAGIKGSDVEVKAGGTLGLDGGSKVVVQGHGDVSDGSVTPAQDQPPIDPFKVLP